LKGSPDELTLQQSSSLPKNFSQLSGKATFQMKNFPLKKL
jgi:hypothetical protein